VQAFSFVVKKPDNILPYKSAACLAPQMVAIVAASSSKQQQPQ